MEPTLTSSPLPHPCGSLAQTGSSRPIPTNVGTLKNELIEDSIRIAPLIRCQAKTEKIIPDPLAAPGRAGNTESLRWIEITPMPEGRVGQPARLPFPYRGQRHRDHAAIDRIENQHQTSDFL